MKLDYISVFPQFFDVLELSLLGKATSTGLVSIGVHDLRDFTHDTHRTVDDTPYGGGAGMVMKPEPWGEAIDQVATEKTTLVVPTPSGTVFTQSHARDLAHREHIVFACGRYEGIDQRVIDEYCSSHEVLELSIGDYVLNGGEVAAIVMTEAIVRLVPGFMGNPESLVEESHEGGLLEYPVYTKPAEWRGRIVPNVLTSGNHAEIAKWRQQQRIERTRRVRPDLLREEQTDS